MTLCPEMQAETKPLSVSERPETPKQKVMVGAAGIAIGLTLLMLTANRHNLTFSTTRPGESVVPRAVWM